MSYVFEITGDELQKASAWLAEQNAAWVASGACPNPLDPGEPYYGAIGGAVTYEFTPTGIGVVTRLRHANGETLDLTDYESW